MQDALRGRAAQSIKQALPAGIRHGDELRAVFAGDRDDRVHDIALPQQYPQFEPRARFVPQLWHLNADMRERDLRARCDQAERALDLAQSIDGSKFSSDCECRT